jgi:Zn-dependent protease
VNVAQLLPALVAVAIFIAVAFPIHEFSHAWAAFKLGDSTARWQGRLTLNPIVHFDPLGGGMLILTTLLGSGFVIGWAKPTPVNPYNLQYGRRGESLVALAGPVSNLVMAAAVAIPLRLILGDPVLYSQIVSNDIATFVTNVAYTFLQINVILFVFNLLPIPPLDGWRVLLGLVDARTAFNLRQYEQFGFVALLVLILAGATVLGGLINTVMRVLLGT